MLSLIMFDVFVGLFLIALLALIKKSQQRDRTTPDGAPFVPLEPLVVDHIMDLAKIQPGEIFYDLGSGDGRLVIAAALRGAKAYGIEIDPFRVWYSRLCIFIFGLSHRAHIIQKSFFEIDLSKANIITTYLLQETNDKLYPKLIKEIKTGTRLVSAAFNFPKLKPVKIDPRGPIYGPLFLYHYKPRKTSISS
ncbi:MAG: 50S ribosomal protein L11 methyltransferase [Candidatus Shapirobacteria bacterium]|jgi:predicted RNA methylase